MMAKYGACLVYLSASVLGTAQAESLALTALGNLELSYTQGQKIASYEGSPLPAQVEILPGNDYWLSTPTNIQQSHFLVSQGQRVSKGQAIVKLTGPEVFHYLAQVEAATSLYQLAKSRYERNKPLITNGNISAEKWREISQDYFTTQLEYEHMQHFMANVNSKDATTDSFVVTAPVDGIVKLNVSSSPYMAGDQLFSLVPNNSIRVKVNVPTSQSHSLSAINIDQCHIAVESVSAIAEGAFVTAWSAALPQECQLLLGQQMTVVPEYQKAVYLLPKNSVFSWEQDSQVFTKSANSLNALTIDILGSTPEQYIVESDQDLSQLDILSQSVAAVKGILLGLGGE
ncbi:MAG: membrane fusion-like protein [Shewanella sp.]